MPLYEYQCAKCGKVFEVIQKYSDTPLTVHEGCGGEVVKLLSASAFHFKGSGWYATDYAKQSTSQPDKSHDKSQSDKSQSDKGQSEGKNGEPKSEGKSESKSESSDNKSESKPSAKTNE
jgi:putative FmdB family regulatory protein